MINMNIKELFDVGCSFESCVGDGTKSERARIPKNCSRINLSDDFIKEISSIGKEINFLVSGEVWCPDFQINISISKKFCDINSNLNISVITMARSKKFSSPILDIKDFKGPTVAILDKDFNIIGIFEERPLKVKTFNNFLIQHFILHNIIFLIND